MPILSGADVRDAQSNSISTHPVGMTIVAVAVRGNVVALNHVYQHQSGEMGRLHSEQNLSG